MSGLQAFVIMPFDPEFDAVYTDLIVPPLEAAGFVVRRADDVEARRNVLVDVVRGIAEADLIVADLTTANANVFYELGLAHAIGVPTVLIAHQESSEDIPFDLRQYRTEFYDTHFQRAKVIVEVLGKLGRSHAAGLVPFGSPISDFLPGAAKPAMRAHRPGVAGSHSAEPAGGATARIDDEASDDPAPLAVIDEEDERGLMDFVEALSEGSDEFEVVAEGIVDATQRVSEEVDAVTQRMNSLDANSPTAAAIGKRLMLQTAQILDRYAEELENRQPEFDAGVDKITSSGLGYVTLLAENAEQFQGQLNSVLETSTELQQTVVGATAGMSEMREAVATIPPVLKQTNRARNRTVRALDALLAQFDGVQSYAEQSIGLAQAGLDKTGPEPAVDEDDSQE